MDKVASEVLKAHYARITSKGGKAVLKKYGKEYFAELGRISARKKKKRKKLLITPLTA